MSDPSFYRCVIWLLKHNEEGSMGLIMNQMGHGDVYKRLENGEVSFPILEGGPVGQDHTFVIHTYPDLTDATPLWQKYMAGGDVDDVLERIDNNSELWVVNGYSGWGPGQLEEEIAAKAWIVAPMNEEVIKSAPNTMWANALKSLGNEYKSYIDAPHDISLN